MIYSVNGPSGGKLAHLLKCTVLHPDMGWNRFYGEWGRDKVRETTIPMVINYGVKKEILIKNNVDPNNCLNYNSEDVADKLKCFEIFDQYNIPHPKVITDPANYEGVFLGRKNHSSQGNGIERFEPKSEDWDKKGSDFFVEYIEVEKEFRVHVIRGATMEFNKDISKCTNFIHSKQYGSKLHFGALDHPDRFKIVNYSIQAVKACGLDYGAVDIIVEKGTGRWLVLEVNSAPSLANSFGYYYAQLLNHQYGLGLKFDWYINKDHQVIKIPDPFFFGREKEIEKKPLTFKPKYTTFKPSFIWKKPTIQPSVPLKLHQNPLF